MADDGSLHVSVLGPIAVRDGSGRDLTPAGALQRRLLALLVLRRGEVVPVDVAIDILWPSEPPRDAAAALQNHLSRLRRGLPGGVIQSVGSGYRIDPTLVDVDADRLDAVLGGLDTPVARAELAATLSRWRGRAYPELEDTDTGIATAVRFAELHNRARESLAAARLGAGELDGLVAELTALAGDEPLRERPRELLMRTLSASGRSAEGLRVYDDFRRLVGDELGIEPSPLLTALHSELLAAPHRSAPRDARVRRLPNPVSALLGRDALLDELQDLAGAVRAVTLVGPGGVGKTRLLIALGHRLGRSQPERSVVLCELTQATADTVDDVVASAMGIDGRPGVPTGDRIVDVVHDADVVMLLDNCEHVLAPAALLAERILTNCPNAHLVTTSRERLRITGEHVRTVPTLPTDDSSVAVDLFVERARAVQPAFGGSDDERARVAEIVRRLDGLPLAIELAAARLHALDLDEVAAGLDRPLSLLSGGSRTSPRHSSLNAVVEWSFGQLDDELQRVFTALSVFARPFAVADAAAVCDLDSDLAADALAQLVERSLVLRTPSRHFAMLETLRAFGTEQLVVSGGQQRVAERHARWMVEWAEDAERRLHRPGEAAMEDVDDAVPELRAAVSWLLDNHLPVHAGRLVAALVNWALLRLRPDVMGWAQRVIAGDPDDRSPIASQVWAAAAYHAWMAGDMPGSAAMSRRAVELAEHEPAGLTQPVVTMRGNLDLFAGRLDEAARWYELAMAVSGENDAQRLIAGGALLLALGYAESPRAVPIAAELLARVDGVETAPAAYLWHCAGEAAMPVDPALAMARFGRAIEIAERTNASFVRGFAGASLASMEARDGDARVAAASYRWLIPHWQRSGLRSTQWTVLRSVVGLLGRLDHPLEAAMLEGAVRSTADGHRIFGADELALHEVGERLRATLGDDAYEAARRDGGELDGNGAAELALRWL